MVVGEKNAEEGRNGRSRGPSPGRSAEESTSEDSDHEGGMRVGADFQAMVPSFNPELKPETRADAMLVWAPSTDVPESKVDEYIHISKEKHSYNMEQALGMLFWHKHNIDKSLTDLANFTPFPDEWTVEDKVLFEQAFSFHGKNFPRIRQMLPDKSIAQLVKYFYSWKKTRSRTSLMDRQAKKLDKDYSDDDMDVSDSDMEQKDEVKASARFRSSPNHLMHLKKTDMHPRNRHRKKPPCGMYLNQADLIALATGPPGQGEALLKSLDAEMVTLKRQVQNNKQLISMIKPKLSAGIEEIRPSESNNRINARWSNEELLMAVQGIRKYGKDFKATAEVIGNKTEAHLRAFFVNFKRRYNLEEVLEEFMKENGETKDEEEQAEDKMDTDDLTPAVGVTLGNSNVTTNGTSSSAPPPPLVQHNAPSTSTSSMAAAATASTSAHISSRAPPPPLTRHQPTATITSK